MKKANAAVALVLGVVSASVAVGLAYADSMPDLSNRAEQTVMAMPIQSPKDFSSLLPKLGQKIGEGSITSVTDKGDGCYQYTVSNSDVATVGCLDLTQEAYDKLPDLKLGAKTGN